MEMDKMVLIFTGLLLALMAFAIGLLIYVVIKFMKEIYGTEKNEKGA